jgi:hypothetical protein
MKTEFFLPMKPPTKKERQVKPMDEWKAVAGYEEIYKVNSRGDIFSEYSKRNLIPYLSNDGYLRVNLCKNKKVKITMLHRIVAGAFIPNPEKFPIVNHIDGNKANPVAENLEWTTCSGNLIHAFSHGLSKISDKCKQAVSRVAAENGAKTTRKSVIQLDNTGIVLHEFLSIREAERCTGISRANIIRACKSMEFSAGGYKWQRV